MVIIVNTIYSGYLNKVHTQVSLYRIIFGFPAPIILALLLNEVYNEKFKRITQTISYLPYFTSWVVLAGIMNEIFSPNRGVVNYIIMHFGGHSINFLAEASLFRPLLVSTGIWQNIGWGSIIYLGAIASISTEQYESAYMDGANRFQIVRFITIPSISSTMSVMFILSLGAILGSGGAGGTFGNLFDQVFNLYNPSVYSTGDIIDTYVYRTGLLNQQYSYSTAVGLFKNVVGLVFVLTGNFIIRRLSNKEQGIW